MRENLIQKLGLQPNKFHIPEKIYIEKFNDGYQPLRSDGPVPYDQIDDFYSNKICAVSSFPKSDFRWLNI